MLHSTSIEVSSPSRQAIECMWLEPINGLPTRLLGGQISIDMLPSLSSKPCQRWRWFDRWSMIRQCLWFRTSSCSRSSRSFDDPVPDDGKWLSNHSTIQQGSGVYHYSVIAKHASFLFVSIHTFRFDVCTDTITIHNGKKCVERCFIHHHYMQV